VLTGVYYIPRLKASILSIGQLDETGCRVDINGGILCIFDQHDVLLAKVAQDNSCLYYLDLVVGRPVPHDARIRGGLTMARPLRAPQLWLTVEADGPEDGARVAGAHSGGEGVRQLLSWQATSCAIPGLGKMKSRVGSWAGSR
jgi:hypothetical protein